MTLTQLKYFQAAARLGNITLAARQLHVSQPSVSLAIKSLEDEFGLALLERSGRSFSLTVKVSLVWNKDSYLSRACADLLGLVRKFGF